MTTLTSLTLNPQATAESSPSTKVRYADNIYFADGAVLTGILTALLYLLLATSLDAAGYVENLALLIPVTIGALVLGFLMSFSRFDGFFALSHSLFTGLAWILFLMTGLVNDTDILPFLNNGIPEAQARAYFVLLRWLNWIDAVFNSAPSNDNYIFVFEMAFLVWWLTYLGVWSIFRFGYTWRAIIPAGIILLINTYYAPDSIIGFLAVFCLLSMLIFVRTNLAEQQLRWREQRVYFNQDISLDFLRNGLLYSVIVLALAWIVPGAGRSIQVRTVMAPLNEQWETTTQRWNELYQGINRQTRASSAAFGRTLSLGGARNVGDEFVFQVSAPRGRYWRAVVYDTYSGRQWLDTGEEEQRFDANEVVPIAPWNQRQEMTQTITLMAQTGNIVFGAPDILRSGIAMEAKIRPTTYNPNASENAVEITMARTRQSLESGDRYIVVSAYANVTQNDLTNTSTEYPQEIIEQYLQLPENTSQRVMDHAKEIADPHPTVYAKARAVETFLRSITYNDAIDAPPPGTDPIEYFLYDIQEGYCDYYATSMAVMLRSLGIPTRIVSGYAEGSFDDESGVYYISERDAHTWVEVYFPGYGWIEFEPTAGESQLNRPSGDDLLATDFLQDGPLPSGGFPGAEEEFLGLDEEFNQGSPFDEEFAQNEGTTNFNRPSFWLWTVLTPLLLIAGLWFIWRTQFTGPTRFDPELPPIFYSRLHSWATRLGLQPATNNTPYEDARDWGRALPEGRPSIDSITEEYVQYRFNRGSAKTGTPIAETVSGKLFSSWKELHPLLWKAWLRKILRLNPRTKSDPFALTNGDQK